MDLVQVLHNVSNIHEYGLATQDTRYQKEDTMLPFNMTTVLALKKNRAFEMEYFLEHHEHGIVFLILRRMIRLPPSKTWGLLGKELVALLQYWLDGVRKYLIRHSPHWWLFLKTLLLFVNEIRLKDTNINCILVKEVAESLLNLACGDQLSLHQRDEVVRCLNQFTSRANREIRAAFQEKFSTFFPKLSSYLATCGHFPSQIAILELLLRWLPNRQSVDVREKAAACWFPLSLYDGAAVKLFLERPFNNFYKDARDFLNAQNSANDNVTSVVCRKLTIGKFAVITSTDKIQSYLDISPAHGCISVLLEPRLLLDLGISCESHEIITFDSENTDSARLQRKSIEVNLTLSLKEKPRLLHGGFSTIIAEQWQNVHICISSKSDVNAVDKALKKTFGNKYTLKLDEVNEDAIFSPESNRRLTSDEDTRFSQPYEPPKRKRAGVIINPHRSSVCKSPSTASTTSLAQLHDKLAALPRLYYERDPVGVCALPDLSCVTEISEPDDEFISTTCSNKTKPRGIGVRRRPKTNKNFKNISLHSLSDNEDISKYFKKRRIISPQVKGTTSPNCLLSATFDESIINDTFDKDELPASITHVNEDMKVADGIPDSGINTDDNVRKTQATDVIEGTQIYYKSSAKLPCTVVNKSGSEEQSVTNEIANKAKPNVKTTSDQSNTDAIIKDTPVFVNLRQNNTKIAKSVPETEIRNFKDIGEETRRDPEFNIDEIEQFFSQHFKENERGELVISPTLARKVNESSSESSQSFDKYLISNVNENFAPIPEEPEYEADEEDIVNCLECMLDKICLELNKCTEPINMEEKNDIVISANENAKATKDVTNEPKAEKGKPTRNTRSKTAKVKLTYSKTVPMRNSKRNIKQGKLNVETAPIEKAEVTPYAVETENPKSPNNKKTTKYSPETDSDTPLIVKRKRKLYSPKDDNIHKTEVLIPETEDDTTTEGYKTKQKPKSNATCYKEIERDRKIFTHRNRNRNSKGSTTPDSPRSLKKNQLFDSLKNNIEGETNLMFVDKKSSEHTIAVYNYTSESEDEDFKAKKIEVQKKKIKMPKNTRQNKKKSEKNCSTDDDTRITAEKPKRQKRKPRNKKNVQPVVDLEDERMRKATPEPADTSFVVNVTNVENKEHVEPKLNFVRKMEPIPEVSLEGDIEAEPSKTTAKKNNKAAKVTDSKTSNDKKEESPLLTPLNIETEQQKNNDGSTSSSNLVEKCNKIIKNGYPGDDTTQNLLDDLDKINNSQGSANVVPLELEIHQNLETTENDVMVVDTTILEIGTHYSPPKTKPKTYEVTEIKNIKRNERQTRIESKDHQTKTKNPAKEIIKVKMEFSKQKSKKLSKSQAIESEIEVVSIDSSVSDVSVEKSIATVGNSPITAHGVNDELPPTVDLLDKRFSHRNLELQNLSPNIKDYFVKLRQINEDTENRATSTKESLKRLIDTKSVSSPAVSLKRLSKEEIQKWLPSSKSSTSSNNTVINRKKTKTRVRTPQKRGRPKKNKTEPKEKNNKQKNTVSDKNITQTLRKSVISPVELDFDEPRSPSPVIDESSSVQMKSQTMEPRYSLRKPVKYPSKSSVTEIQEVRQGQETPESESAKKRKITLRKPIKYPSKSPVSETKDEVRKRQATSESGSAKKRKIESRVDKMEAVSPSVRSVHEWFSKYMPSSNTDGGRQAYKDCMQNVLEKLDTTLFEIHQSTSKKFVHMFVELQERQQRIQAERTEIFRDCVRDIFKGFLKIVDEKFSDCEEKCKSLDEEFSKELKAHAVDVMRDEFKQKQALVTLLRDDVRSALRQSNKRFTY